MLSQITDTQLALIADGAESRRHHSRANVRVTITDDGFQNITAGFVFYKTLGFNHFRRYYTEFGNLLAPPQA